jgi:hypothetical protein
MPGDAVTHKMQLLFWEKNEKYFSYSRRYARSYPMVPSFLPSGFGSELACRSGSSALRSKKFSDRLTGRSPLAPEANPAPSPKGCRNF